MIYMGLDLSTVSTGWSVFEDVLTGSLRLVTSGKIKPPSTLDTMARIKHIADKIGNLIDMYTNPGAQSKVSVKVVIEDVFYGKNYLMTKVLNRLAGAVMYAIMLRYNSLITVITATAARKAFGLLPASKKHHVVTAVNRQFGKTMELSDNDEADAIVLGYYGWVEDHKPDESFKKTDREFYKTNLKMGVRSKKIKGLIND